MKSYKLVFGIIFIFLCSFIAIEKTDFKKPKKDHIQIVRLSEGDTAGFSNLRATFVERNPSYDLDFFYQVSEILPKEIYRLAFVQNGEGKAQLSNNQSSAFSVGDIIFIDKGQRLTTDSLLDVLVFDVPDPLPNEIPPFIRPDWDPNITDIPGGCATERNAYRRILLTWEDNVGEYLYHALNAHRVRIMDSFTHYHPVQGGFDEFYLVQMALPEAKLITSNQVDLIRQSEKVTKKDTEHLLDTTELQKGDLVYIPRGIAHRGLGGVLTQVITVPGFIPGSEIGIDHHLKAINDKFLLEGKDALPLNESASLSEVIK